MEKIGRDDQEVNDYLDSDLPLDAFMTHSRIGREYGTFAATFWRFAVFEGNLAKAQNIMGASLKDEDVKKQVANAIQNKFQVPPNQALDQEIMRRYNRIRQNSGDLSRRTETSQRFKDMMAYIGGAAIFGFIAYRLNQTVRNT